MQKIKRSVGKDYFIFSPLQIKTGLKLILKKNQTIWLIAPIGQYSEKHILLRIPK